MSFEDTLRYVGGAMRTMDVGERIELLRQEFRKTLFSDWTV